MRLKEYILVVVLFLSLDIGALVLPMDKFMNEPANAPSVLKVNKNGKSFTLGYNNHIILEAYNSSKGRITSSVVGKKLIKQYIRLKFDKLTETKIVVNGSSEALAAETRGQAQKNFELVRTSHGLSNNLRNNAVYDRNLDWMLETPEGTKIKSYRNKDGTSRFEFIIKAKEAVLIFRPRYFQKHKNLVHFEPWKYKVYKESVTGWNSWWAYSRGFTEIDHLNLLEVWEKKHMGDYGYRFIQIDDAYQGEKDKGRKNSKEARGYLGGRPTTWLDWKKDVFPSGLFGYTNSVNKAGLSPAIWMGCFFSDEETVQKHPDWFVTDKEGNPIAAPWVSYILDATNPEVVEALIRPTFRGLKNAGVQYVKIDQLRHYLYDNLHNNLEWCKRKGITPAELIRAYMQVARDELGEDSFVLSCWGVLTEVIGIADGCRIGGDGYGPITMQQYNSWNGIVWRNDPDHCDVFPNKKAIDVGNVKNTEKRNAVHKETILRPALASIAGAMLMLSDKPEVYENDQNLIGLRRSSPVLFSVPGQLYDFDERKTDWLKKHKRTEIKTGKFPSSMDGDQFGKVCSFWLNEFNKNNENWNVLHRINWPQGKKEKLKPTTVKFTDLGLDASKEYIVFEFWKEKLLGVMKDEIHLGELEYQGLESLAIREKLERPQLISTNRHLSQGAAEIEMIRWEENHLKGRSHVIVDDEYVITLYVPNNYKFHSATVNGVSAKIIRKGHLLRIAYLPLETSSLSWDISFTKI